MKVGYVDWVSGLVMLLDELGQTLIEKALDQHHIVSHIRKSAFKAELALREKAIMSMI